MRNSEYVITHTYVHHNVCEKYMPHMAHNRFETWGPKSIPKQRTHHEPSTKIRVVPTPSRDWIVAVVPAHDSMIRVLCNGGYPAAK